MVHVDITDQIDLATETVAYYADFYKWDFTPERFREARAQTGREAGVKFAEKFHYRSAYAPALDYLV